jgi:hypothetical protein
MIWFVYSPDKLDSSLKYDPDTTVLSIHDYKNALEVLKKEKPDIIYATPWWAFIDYAFILAGKFLKIPIVCHTTSGIHFEMSRVNVIKSFILRFFESSIPTDTGQSKKQFMRRGRFFIYKYLFLLRTQIAIKISRLKIIATIFIIFNLYLSSTRVIFDSRFDITLNFLDNEKLLEDFLKGGFNRSNLILTGNPIYDEVFEELSRKKHTIENNKVHVLFAPTPEYEHGLWTRVQRDTAVKEIMTKILEYKEEFSITVKIHPSYSILSEYTSLINSLVPSIHVYQEGNILKFLTDADVVIFFSFTTAGSYAVLAKKPIIMCHFFTSKIDTLSQRGLAVECKNSADLVNCIHKSMSQSHNPGYEKERENFIREFMYKWDGRATERICDEIMKLLNKNNDKLIKH